MKGAVAKRSPNSQKIITTEVLSHAERQDDALGNEMLVDDLKVKGLKLQTLLGTSHTYRGREEVRSSLEVR